jgi:Lrp/AsnC family transcriptional regulator for asnA, asnC and gidA
MDKLDYQILSELLKNAQISLLKIANKLDISPLTVRKRYEKMVSEGVIKKAVVTIDISKLCYQGKAYLLITNAPNASKAKTIEALQKMKGIILISEIIGPIDILAIAPVTDLNSIKNLVSEIKKLPSVQKVEISCTGNTIFPVSQTYGEFMSQKCIDLAAVSKKKNGAQ